MITTLIIARHGNTFEDGEPPRRVGRRTDLPLTKKGQEQAQTIGKWLKANHHKPAAAWCGTLQRTQLTARLALAEAGVTLEPQADATLDEIDYGPDEDKPEADVLARIGEEALKEWEANGVPPPGWSADPKKIIADWIALARRVIRGYDGKTTLVVTSNGIARFAPHLTGDFEAFKARYPLKLSTGAIGVLAHDSGRWSVRDWNVKP